MATQASPIRTDTGEMSFEEYLEAYNGIHAEWVDGRVCVTSPGTERQGRLSLGSTGVYEPVALGEPPVLRSEMLAGMTIPVSWLWDRPLPATRTVFAEWGP